MQDFDYVLARSASEVIARLCSDGDGVRILSGGTDLLPQLREGRKEARLLVDVKAVPEANELGCDPAAGLRIGAAVPCYRITGDEQIARLYPGLIDAVALIGGVQIQGRATVGGNLCNASPAADSIPALIVHRAVAVIAGPNDLREVPVEEFCTGPGRNCLRPGEFLLALRIPPPLPRYGAGYLRFIPRNEMDIAVVGAGAALALDSELQTITSARIALGAVAPVPLLVPEAGAYLIGRPASAETLAEAANIARSAARPITDMRGSAAQRRHLAGVLTRRALERAVERALQA